jgi:hypothetical protein
MSGGGSSSDVPETAAERALAEVSAGKWDAYQKQFVPLEDKYMREVDAMAAPTAQANVANMAMNKARESTLGLQADHNQQMFGRGIDPSQGAYQGKSRALNQAISKTQQNAYNQGLMAAKNAHVQGLGNVVAMGNGQDTASFNGTRSLADQSARTAINDSQRDFNKQQADSQLTGQVIGAGVGYGVNSYFKTPSVLNYNMPSNGAPTNTVSLSGGSGYGFGGSNNGFGVSLKSINQGFN